MHILPPLHPILVHVPVAMIPFVAAFDVVGSYTKKTSLQHAAWWCLLAATVVAPLTAISGWLRLREMGMEADDRMVVHQWLGTIIPVLLILLMFWRYRIHQRSDGPPSLFLILISLMAGLITLQGHVGGQMTFGVADPNSNDSGPSPPHLHVPHHATSLPTTQKTEPPAISTPTEADGWSDSIKIRGGHHE